MYKTSKRAVSMGLCLALTLSSLSIPFSTLSSAKAKLIKSKISMTVGQKTTITIKGKKKRAKYSFSSSSVKKAVVSKKGVITAKKKGTVKITVKVKYKKKMRKVGTVTVVIQAKTPNTKVPTNTPAVTTPAVTTAPTATPTASPSATPVPTPTRTPRVTATPYPEDPAFSDLPKNYSIENANNKGIVERFDYVSTKYYDGTDNENKKPIDRYAMVVLPKDYSKTKKYPVIYMLHGLSDIPENMVGDGITKKGDGVQFAAWNAMANGDLPESILVFPCVCCNEAGKSGFATDPVTTAAYDYIIHDLTEVLMPAINKEYSTLTGRENTAVCGFSMGGRETLNIIMKKPDLFGAAGAFNPAPGVLDGGDMLTEQTFLLPEEYKDNTYIQITKGAKDSTVGNNPVIYHNALTKNNVPHAYYETMEGDPAGTGNGGHWKTVYLHGFYNFAKRIFRK